MKLTIKHIIHGDPSVFVSAIEGVIISFYFSMILFACYLTCPPLPFLLSAKQAVDLDKWVCLLTCLFSCTVCPNQPGSCPRSCPVAHWMSY